MIVAVQPIIDRILSQLASDFGVSPASPYKISNFPLLLLGPPTPLFDRTFNSPVVISVANTERW